MDEFLWEIFTRRHGDGWTPPVIALKNHDQNAVSQTFKVSLSVGLARNKEKNAVRVNA
jgi:hypothetical protein